MRLRPQRREHLVDVNSHDRADSKMRDLPVPHPRRNGTSGNPKVSRDFFWSSPGRAPVIYIPCHHRSDLRVIHAVEMCQSLGFTAFGDDTSDLTELITGYIYAQLETKDKTIIRKVVPNTCYAIQGEACRFLTPSP